MSEKPNEYQIPTRGTDASIGDSLLKPNLSRNELMELLKVAASAPCPSRDEMVSLNPSLENERNVVSTLDNAQKILADNKKLMQQGETMLNQFRIMLDQTGLVNMPSLSPADVTEVGRLSVQTDKRCIETRVGRTS